MELLQKNQIHFKSKFTNLFKMINFALKTTFSSARIYLYCFLLPIVFFASFYLIFTSFGYVGIKSLDRVSTLATLIVAVCFSQMSAGCVITNWKYSVMIKQFKVLRVHKSDLIISLLLTTIITTFMSYLALIAFGCFIDIFLANKNFITSLSIIESFSQVIGIFFALIIGSIITFSMAYLITFLINSPLLIQTVNFLLIMFFIVSTNIYGLNLVSKIWINNIFNVMGYFNPLKSVQWILFSSYANLVVNADNARQIIASAYGDFSFTFSTNNINLVLWISILTAFGWASAFLTATCFIKIKK